MTLKQLLANSTLVAGVGGSRDRPGRGSGQRRAVAASPATGLASARAAAGP